MVFTGGRTETGVILAGERAVVVVGFAGECIDGAVVLAGAGRGGRTTSWPLLA